MKHCKTCDITLPSEEKYKVHVELLHPEELQQYPINPEKLTSVAEQALAELGVKVSDTFPEDPVAGQIHYDCSYNMHVWDGEKWITLKTPIKDYGTTTTTSNPSHAYTWTTHTGSGSTTYAGPPYTVSSSSSIEY